MTWLTFDLFPCFFRQKGAQLYIQFLQWNHIIIYIGPVNCPIKIKGSNYRIHLKHWSPIKKNRRYSSISQGKKKEHLHKKKKRKQRLYIERILKKKCQINPYLMDDPIILGFWSSGRDLWRWLSLIGVQGPLLEYLQALLVQHTSLLRTVSLEF